ncbi:hypothetical protein DFO67_106190 [Modicisalibacter xianhensis]|uniref:Lipoprotein n=1 Tax=Modicisalibacter xianhensis TaxID=442341 RepID=A0A4R8FTE1_9GAMM|nr:hypothetical protein DFO67_106190 [Halomonas xianhensis]
MFHPIWKALPLGLGLLLWLSGCSPIPDLPGPIGIPGL